MISLDSSSSKNGQNWCNEFSYKADSGVITGQSGIGATFLTFINSKDPWNVDVRTADKTEVFLLPLVFSVKINPLLNSRSDLTKESVHVF